MFCVKCGSRLEETWGHCSNCGTKIEQSQTPPLSVTENPYKSKSPKFKLGCGGIVAVVIALGLISSSLNLGSSDVSNSTSAVASEEPLETPQEQWYPDGYYESPDGLTAWKWADRECSYNSGSCWHVDVIPKVGCQNLYVEINIFDSSDAVIDWSNDTAKSIQAGQVAKLEFTSYNDSASTGQVVDISCY